MDLQGSAADLLSFSVLHCPDYSCNLFVSKMEKILHFAGLTLI